MAVTVDVATELVRTLTTDPQTWTHTPVGTPKGVLVSAIHGVNSTDSVASVTYGGVNMVRVRRNVDTVTEPGAAEWWWLSGPPAGAQTVSVDLTSATTDDFQFVSITLLAASRLGIVNTDGIDENVANPVLTPSRGGLSGMAFGALYGGGAAPGGTIQAGCTRVFSEDLGNFYADVIRETTGGTADTSIGFSTLVADDVAFGVVVVAETVAASTLFDDFADASIDTSKWSAGTVGAGTTIVETTEITETPAASTVTAESYLPGVDFLAKYDLTGDNFRVNLKQALNADPADTSFTTFHVIFNDSNEVWFGVSGTTRTLFATQLVNGVQTDLANVTYNSTTHAWLKIREASGTMFWDISSDGITYSNFTSTANPIPVTSLYPKLVAYADNVASPGAAKWDSFNITPAGGVSASITQVAATVTATGGIQAVATVRNVSIAQVAATVTATGSTQVVAAGALVNATVTQVAATVTAAGGNQVVASSQKVAIAQVAASVTATGGTQTVATVNNVSIAQVAGSVTVAGGIQVVAASRFATIVQVAATVTATGGVQTVQATGSVAITQVAANVTASGGTQVLSASRYVSVAQIAGTVTATGGTQVITATSSVSIAQVAGTVTVTGGAQTVTIVGALEATTTKLIVLKVSAPTVRLRASAPSLVLRSPRPAIRLKVSSPDLTLKLAEPIITLKTSSPSITLRAF